MNSGSKHSFSKEEERERGNYPTQEKTLYQGVIAGTARRVARVKY